MGLIGNRGRPQHAYDSAVTNTYASKDAYLFGPRFGVRAAVLANAWRHDLVEEREIVFGYVDQLEVGIPALFRDVEYPPGDGLAAQGQEVCPIPRQASQSVYLAIYRSNRQSGLVVDVGSILGSPFAYGSGRLSLCEFGALYGANLINLDRPAL